MARQLSPLETFLAFVVGFVLFVAVITFTAGIRAVAVYLIWNYAAVAMCPLMLSPITWVAAWLCGFASLLLFR
jgi:hypothetical protein